MDLVGSSRVHPQFRLRERSQRHDQRLVGLLSFHDRHAQRVKFNRIALVGQYVWGWNFGDLSQSSIHQEVLPSCAFHLCYLFHLP